MVLTKKRLQEISNVILNMKNNEYSKATTIKVKEANAGPHILLSVKIRLELKDIDKRMNSCFYSTTGIQNVMRKMYPDEEVSVDGFTVCVYPNDLHIDFFIWIRK